MALRFLTGAGALAVAFLLMAGWLNHLHPALDSIGHFRLHLLVLGLVALPLAISAQLKSVSISLFSTLIISLLFTFPYLPSLGPSEARATGAHPGIRVAQFNVRYNNGMHRAIADALRAADADVLLLQEMSREQQPVLDLLHDTHPHQRRCNFRYFRGIVIVSRLPFEDGQSEGCEIPGAVHALIDTAIGRVTFVSLHTYWPWPYQQAEQVRKVVPALAKLEGPMIIGGDFNATPWSNTVQSIAAATKTRPAPGLRLSFMLQAMKQEDTRFGGLPLDHILLAQEFEVTGILPLEDAGSDHLGYVSAIRRRVQSASN